jgi:hypothetical protein
MEVVVGGDRHVHSSEYSEGRRSCDVRRCLIIIDRRRSQEEYCLSLSEPAENEWME